MAVRLRLAAFLMEEKPLSDDQTVFAGTAIPEAPPEPIGSFLNAVRSGDLLFISGQGPVDAEGRLMTGTVGAEVTIEQATAHARLVGLNLLAVARAELGSLQRIRRVVKLFGMVNAVPGFREHPTVINGCSELLVEVLGEAGRHARSAVGVASLPNDITVEVEAIFEVRPEPAS